MPRIKIASIKTSSNQKRIIKTAQRAINLSTAFDQQGSYKNSSDFLNLPVVMLDLLPHKKSQF